MFVFKIKGLDWIDIAIHVGLALGGMSLLYVIGVPLWFLLGLNTVFWPARELFQHKPDYQEIITHPQSLAEWLCPVIAGFAMYGILT